MNITRYLIIEPHKSRPSWGDPSISIVKSVAGKTMKGNAIALKLDLKLPNELFIKPQLSATIKVSKDAVQNPIITAEAIHTIEESIRSTVGVDLKIEVVVEPDPESQIFIPERE